MKVNEGTIDRVARIAAGVLLFAIAFFAAKPWLTVFGVVMLLTGAVGFCPLYRLIGIDTCRARV